MTPTATRLDAGPGYRYTYIVYTEAWWWTSTREIDPRPRLSITKDHEGGGCAWDFAVVEEEFSDRSNPITVRLFDEAFPAFSEMAPFFATLADRQPTTLDQVRAILDELGVVDSTERTNPNR